MNLANNSSSNILWNLAWILCYRQKECRSRQKFCSGTLCRKELRITLLACLSLRLLLRPYKIQPVWDKDVFAMRQCFMWQCHWSWEGSKRCPVSMPRFNPSNAEATFVQSTRTKKTFENHFNPIMFVFIEYSQLSQGFSHVLGSVHHFVLAKLVTSSWVNPIMLVAIGQI